jgi:hypothetical protein
MVVAGLLLVLIPISAAASVSLAARCIGPWSHTDRTHSNMSQAIRPPAEEEALAQALHEGAERLETSGRWQLLPATSFLPLWRSPSHWL